MRRLVIDVDGAPASYREAGAGIGVIVTAGLGLTSRFYEQSYPAFADAGIRLVVPDLPGWGDTPGPRGGLSPAAAMSFLLAFGERIGLDKAIWVGHSLGAHAVTRIAADRPARARALVLVGPTGAHRRLRLPRQAWALARETRRTSWGVIAAAARDYLSTSPARYIGTWVRHARDDLPGSSARVQCPTLLIAGDADPVCPPSFIELLRNRMRDVRIVRIAGGTHALPRGHAAAFNRAVIGFVHEIARRS